MQTQSRVGQTLGNYRLVRLLGNGGHAEVYLAEHIYLEDVQVAIKVLKLRDLDPLEQEKFRSEAKFMMTLIHPRVIKMLDYGIEMSQRGSDGSTPYLVMEYAPLGTLRHLYRHGIPMPLPEIVTYTKQFAEALQYAHGKGIIHRDVKPENMLVRKSNDAAISDFGIAIAGLSTQNLELQQAEIAQKIARGEQVTIPGTAPYLAPERIQGHTQRASDQYSLAIIVYEWLCGSRPFTGSDLEICQKHAYEAPPSLRDHGILQEIEAVVNKALAKKPSDRYASVQDFALALEAAVPSSQPNATSSFSSLYIQPPNGNAQAPGGQAAYRGQPNANAQGAGSWPANAQGSGGQAANAQPPNANVQAPGSQSANAQQSNANAQGSGSQSAYSRQPAGNAQAPGGQAAYRGQPNVNAQGSGGQAAYRGQPNVNAQAPGGQSANPQPPNVNMQGPGGQSAYTHTFPGSPPNVAWYNIPGQSWPNAEPTVSNATGTAQGTQPEGFMAELSAIINDPLTKTQQVFVSDRYFIKTKKTRLFRLGGTFLNILSMLIMFVSNLSWPGLLLTVGGVLAIAALWRCTISVKKPIAIAFGAGVALWWAIVIGSVIGRLGGDTLVVPGAFIAFAVSLGIHVWYVNTRLNN